MGYLLFAIGCSTANHLIFKAIANLRIQLHTAIAVNYATCVAIGWAASSKEDIIASVFRQPWYFFSLAQGLLLFTCFILIGKTTRHHGVAAAGLASRLAVAIPTVAAFFLYKDTTGIAKSAGICMAFTALFLSCLPTDDTRLGLAPRFRLLPVWLFLCFGAHSTLLKLVQDRFLGGSSYHAYVMASFLAAFAAAAISSVYQLYQKQSKLKAMDVAAGIGLGCVNYGAVYFLIRVLGASGWQSSRIFPTISIAVVVFSTLCSYLLFNEKISRNMFGAMGLGIAAIVLINQ